MKIFLFPHGGSGNHGCEAIVRGTKIICNANLTLASYNPQEDNLYGLGNVCDSIIPHFNPIKRDFRYIKSRLKQLIYKDYEALDKLSIEKLISTAATCDIALSIGGDNYCYGIPKQIMFINRQLRKLNIPTVLWGCSIEPDALTPEVLKDLSGYSLISARESLTLNLLRDAGLKNIMYYPDPAFLLPVSNNPITSQWEEGKMIGINASPMILDYSQNSNITLKNYENLIEYILRNTEYSIALIPHVVWSTNNDMKPLLYLYEKYKKSNRIILVPDSNAEVLKGYISKCRIMVAARTHASIAAYSTEVPTIVMGYSIKSKGLATDIFGTTENYVIPVKELQGDFKLVSSFKYIEKNYNAIKEHYSLTMKAYIKKASDIRICLDNIIEN